MATTSSSGCAGASATDAPVTGTGGTAGAAETEGAGAASVNEMPEASAAARSPGTRSREPHDATPEATLLSKVSPSSSYALSAATNIARNDSTMDSTKATQPRTMGSRFHEALASGLASSCSSRWMLPSGMRTAVAQLSLPRIMTPSVSADPPICVRKSSPSSAMPPISSRAISPPTLPPSSTRTHRRMPGLSAIIAIVE